MKKLLMSLVICTHFSALTACSTMNSNFDCPLAAGVNCKSLDQVNRMVDSGQIRGRNDITKISSTTCCNAEFEAFPTGSFSSGAPIRYGETVQRIWIAPYEDTEGNYHQDNLIYTIMKDGHWIGRPVKAIKSS